VVRVVLSTDGGANFRRPIEISAGRLAGYVGLAFVGEESLAISWVGRNRNGNNSLLLRTLSMDGTLGEVRNVAEIAQLRVFPRLGFQDNHVFLFWTDQAGDARRLRGAKVPLL
ncbi:MAG: hypothetical protein JJ992_25065, partial [Planctomycetes bacterium]|nr:hypothetical protein [Planctomycetota bacterium]